MSLHAHLVAAAIWVSPCSIPHTASQASHALPCSINGKAAATKANGSRKQKTQFPGLGNVHRIWRPNFTLQCLIATMDFVAFYVILQGPFYKNGICQVNFGNTFFIFATFTTTQKWKKKKADTYTAHQRKNPQNSKHVRFNTWDRCVRSSGNCTG
jgi:ubiquitin C-terminal hydrolase